jgi:hypothetical protein
MSGTNGDKSRFHRQRKHKVEQRVRNRELQMSLAKQVKATPASSGAKPKVTVA